LPKENPDLDATHISFWRDLSQEMNVDERGKLAHFIEWHYNLQHDRGADIFLPPVPYVTLKGVEFLIGKAIEINILAQDMIDGDVATYFSIDAEVFKNREAVERILNYIYKNPNKCRFVIFEIHNPEKILQPGFGLSSLEHLALFLRTIKSMKETTTRIFGLLNGGGFGYCLLGAGFDFFTDTISNYVEFPQKRAGHRPRKFLNPITITPESFEDIENYWLDHGSLPDDCETCEDEYNNVLKVFNRKTIDLDKWSVDCRKHGINVWNRLTREVINSINHNNDGLFYEIVQRTFTYTKLTPIIRDIDLL